MRPVGFAIADALEQLAERPLHPRRTEIRWAAMRARALAELVEAGTVDSRAPGRVPRRPECPSRVEAAHTELDDQWTRWAA
jgi:hypothetical protein